MRNRAIGAVAVTAVCVLGAVTAAAAHRTFYGHASGPVSVSDAMRELRQEELALPHLAPGWSWRNTPTFSAKGPDGAPVNYERGYGRAWAGSYWFCSWATAYSNAPAGTSAERRATREMQKVRSTYFYKESLLAQDRNYIDGIAKSAEEHHRSEVKQFAKASCTYPKHAKK